jgi:hypothetical protein
MMDRPLEHLASNLAALRTALLVEPVPVPGSAPSAPTVRVDAAHLRALLDDRLPNALAALKQDYDALLDRCAKQQLLVDAHQEERRAEARARYPERLTVMRAVAYAHGYALAVHGSELRDLDVVAVPWIEGAAAPAVLVEALRAAVCGVYRDDDAPTAKPHGRLVWSLQIGGGLYVDLSVMPRQEGTDR